MSGRWISPVPPADDFGDPIVDEFIDGKTEYGPWGLMTPKSFKLHGWNGKLGPGLGQRFKKDEKGLWPKVEG